MGKILYYKRLTRKLRAQQGLPQLMDEDDQNSSLNQIARILKKRRKAKAAATDPSSDAPVASDNGDASGSTSPPPSTSSTPESEPSAGAAESPQLSQQPLKTVTNTIVSHLLLC